MFAVTEFRFQRSKKIVKGCSCNVCYLLGGSGASNVLRVFSFKQLELNRIVMM